MQLAAISIRNYRRLKDVTIELDETASIFVGANNSGKTSATHVLKSFLGRQSDREPFSIHDFSVECWNTFNAVDREADPSGALPSLPAIGLDLWFDIGDEDLVHVRDLLPSLDWDRQPIGVRLEYAPVDTGALLEKFREARRRARGRSQGDRQSKTEESPWPSSLFEYLRRHLRDEYKIYYYVLDRTEFDDEWRARDGCTPSEIGTATSARKNIDSLIRVDFLNAQRHLSDSEDKSRTEDLSRRLSRYYERYLRDSETSFEAEQALVRSESALNSHLASVFDPLLAPLRTLGYPGLADPHLVVQASLRPDQIIGQSPSVHYSLTGSGSPAMGERPLTLPDRYNGLGFKNLIYMVIEMLDFNKHWTDDAEDRAALHLLVIEEPEAHLHAQLQQVFIQQIASILPVEPGSAFATQMIVTTHSAHIVYARGFEAVRYFRRTDATGVRHRSEVLNLSHLEASEDTSHTFLRKYMKLTHCDLFFADAAVMVEGNVERLLMPLMIERSAPGLHSSYISILEIGGAFAHVFERLVHFLGLPTLVITDLDSVKPGRSSRRKACPPEEPNAVSSNPVLTGWAPGMTTIADLLRATDKEKTPKGPAPVRVAYQTREAVSWHGEQRLLVGRTFEIAFAYRNLEWCQDPARRDLHMEVRTRSGDALALDKAAMSIHDRVTRGTVDKTDFALALMAADVEDPEGWAVPAYIAEGLQWLLRQLQALADGPEAIVAKAVSSGPSA
jgi:predicted ATP-dependent endonuclease of OLD family